MEPPSRYAAWRIEHRPDLSPPSRTLIRSSCTVHNLYNHTGKTCPTPNLDPQNGLKEKPLQNSPQGASEVGEAGEHS